MKLLPVSAVFLLVILSLSGVTATRHLNGPKKFSVPACAAVRRRDGEFIRGLLNKGIEYICKVTCGDTNATLLHEAAVEEAITAADLILTPPANCSVDSRDAEGNTPLHAAVAICQSPMTDLFLGFGADPDAINDDGDTPLCLAAALDSERCGGVVQSLVRDGANCSMPCNGTLPADLAVNKVTKDIFAKVC